VDDDDMCLLVMERLDGGTVWSKFTSTGMSHEASCSAAIATCEGLHYAHQKGVLHRDVKPENVMIRDDGRIKLTDFGIARLESADRTRTNVIMGTPGYIAPELYLGGQVDHRLDIFAAGVLFYQLLARKSPFRGGPEAIMHDVCYHDPEPASKADPNHRWPQYDEIVSRAIAKAPAERFQSAGEFRSAILDAYAQPVANTISEATIVTHRSRSTFADPGPGSGAGGAVPSSPSPKTFTVSSPSAPPPTGWSGVVLAGVEVEIAKYVGPVAKVLVRRAAKEYKDLESLVGSLMPAIDDPKERSAFARAVLGKPMTTPLRAVLKPSDGTAPPATRPGDVLSAADLERATKVLIGYIGPIGKVVAKRAATEGVSRRDFFAKVAGSLDNDDVRERFMREAGFVEV